MRECRLCGKRHREGSMTLRKPTILEATNGSWIWVCDVCERRTIKAAARKPVWKDAGY